MSSKKRIILFALPSFHVGGIERQLLKMLPHFDRDRYEFHLLTFFHNEGKPDLYKELPSYVQAHHIRFRPGLDIRAFWQTLKFLRALSPDLVVSSMVFPNTIMRMLKPLVGYKVISREHNTYTDKTLRHKLRDHFCSYFSDAIVAVSEEVADYAAKQAWIPRQKFTVIQNGIDLDAIRAYRDTHKNARDSIFREFDLSPKTRILLNVARIKPQKNHSLLIEAFARFSVNHPDFVLFIVGGGADEEKMRSKVRELGLEQKIMLTGYRPDVYSFYMAAEWFILTSDIEGFPNVVVEAMAFGLPVLSTRVSGIGGIVKESVSGFTLERNPQAICAKLEHVARSITADMYKLLRANCLVSAEQYSVKDTTEHYQQLFISALNK